jgi:putative protease
MTLKKPELLAPVGSFESIHSAIKAGADAIYFGVEQLNMRTKVHTDNNCLEDIEEVSTDLPYITVSNAI